MKTVGDSLFHTTLILTIVSLCLPKRECTLVIHPQNSTAIATTTAILECNSSTTDDEILWFKKGIGSSEDIEIKNGYENRYEIWNDSSKSSLYITSSTIKDSGEFYCRSKKSDNTQNTATLDVIAVTSTWFPSCRQYPERVASGTNVKITCISFANGLGTTLLPDLKWTLNNELIADSSPFRNATHSINTYTSTVNRVDHGKKFVCHASLISDFLHNPPMCTVTLDVDTKVINDWRHGDNNILPYIIVAVLSLIAIILFVIVIIFVFRFRECKYCKESVPQPQQVLDMSAIEDGVGVPMTLLTDQSSDDEPVGSSKSKKKKTKPKEPAQTKPSAIENVQHTAQGQKFEEEKMNFDYNFQKPDRKETGSKTKNIDLKMKHSKEKKQPKTTKNQTENTTGLSVRKQPTTAHGRPRSMPNKNSKKPIDNVNNLGNFSEPTRPRSKQSVSKRTTDSQPTGDTVVYADLNFARSLGLNITKDENL